MGVKSPLEQFAGADRQCVVTPALKYQLREWKFRDGSRVRITKKCVRVCVCLDGLDPTQKAALSA